MPDIPVQDYLNKIVMLEKRVGVKMGYRILEPFQANSHDVVDIQAAARRIGEFAGLGDKTFVVGFAKQQEGTAGHTEPRYGHKEVFVELSRDITDFPAAVLATLAHEISHHFLYFNNLYEKTRLAYEFENEVLTDIAGVFLGYGKLLLNGSECVNVTTEPSSDGGTRTTTTTLKTGYLGRDQLAFVYRLVCAMRRTSREEYERGLSSQSLQTLFAVEADYARYFDGHFHEEDIQERLAADLLESVRDFQTLLSEVEWHQQYIKGAFCGGVGSFLDSAHKRVVASQEAAKGFGKDNEYDPDMRFLNAVEVDRAIASLISNLEGWSVEARRYREAVVQVSRWIQEFGDPFPSPSVDMFTVVKCRNSGHRFRLPEGHRKLLAICPGCGYRFIADTSLQQVGERLPAGKESLPAGKESLLKRIGRVLFGSGQ